MLEENQVNGSNDAENSALNDLNEAKREKQMKKKKWRRVSIFLKFFFVILIVAGGSGYFYLQNRLDQTMGNRVGISGIDVSLLTVEDAAAKIQQVFGKTKIVLEEDGQQIYETTFSDAGFTLASDELVKELEMIKERQGSTRLLGEEWKNYSLDLPLVSDDTQAVSILSEDNYASQAERKDSVDAYIYYDEGQGQYVVAADVLGNHVDIEKLLVQVKETVEEGIKDSLLGNSVSVVIDDSTYIPAAVSSADEGLIEKAKELNNKLETYLSSTVTYILGKKTREEIDEDMIRSWLKIDGEDISLDDEQIWLYVDNLATQYNTLYNPRYLETTGNGTVELSNNEYGYWIDTDTEFDRLIQDLQGGESVEREPIYDTEGYMREGKDDLCGNYVEISISDQHLWMYKDGELVTETDIVSGQLSGTNPKSKEVEDWSTHKGAYGLAYKESPSTLSSDIYGYSVQVNYWMPFVLGQGLHDMTSRSAFGGQIYKTSGSHGCVNLPLDQAAIIYENIEEGYPILIY